MKHLSTHMTAPVLPRFTLTPSRFWKRKEGFTGMPARVSLYGAMPHPKEAYEIAEAGFSIYDRSNNTVSNYFFGKIGIDTEAEGNAIIARLIAPLTLN